MKGDVTGRALRAPRLVWVTVGAISIGVNLLLLASPLYMLQVYDRVLTGRSIETLLFLSVAVALALAVMGALDACRALITARFGDWLEGRLAPPVLAASLSLTAQPTAQPSGQPFNDLSTIRQFLASPGFTAMFDAPMMPAFIAVIWLIHPALGAIALGAALLLALMALTSEALTRRSTHSATEAGAEGQTLLSGIVAGADVARTMGLTGGLTRRWTDLRNRAGDYLLASTSRLGVIGAASKAIRLAVQSAILGTGAFLVLDRKITPGEMIAASIILGRALAPVEVAIGSWRQFVASRQGWRRLVNLLTRHAAQPTGAELPAPKGALSLEKVILAGQPGSEPMLRNLSFAIPAGAALGVLGPSGSGKSCLARLITGGWEPGAGNVRIDGADLSQWDPAALGPHIGYLPQGAELFAGSVRDNIARFTDAPIGQVVLAADKARAHDMILGLPNGYDTQVGARGERLSGGQRQRVALSRALFGSPRLVVLDEPDASLDQPGHEALMQCMGELKREGVTLVVIAHRRQALAMCDFLLVLDKGQLKAFGPAQAVVEKLGLGAAKPPLRAVPSGGGNKQ